MRTHLAVLAVGCTFLVWSCDDGTPEQEIEDRGAFSARLTLSLPDHGVSSVVFSVLGADEDCAGNVLASKTVTLGGKLSSDGAAHAFADTLFVLPAGTYRVCATPMAGDSAADECEPGSDTVEVAPAETQELVLVSQCIGPDNGGLGAVIELNDPPRIQSVSLEPARYITVCEAVEIDVLVEDPNQDAFEVSFSVSAGPAGSHLRSLDGHANFFGPAGDYELNVVAKDVHQGASSLAFPIHVADAQCETPPAVQAIFETRCAPCHITGSSGGLHLTPASASYAALVGSPVSAAACATRTRVVPGDAANSYLLAKLRAAPDICGAPMPRGQPMLPAEEIAAIEAWINALPH